MIGKQDASAKLFEYYLHFYRGLVKIQPPVIITEIVLVCFLKNNENKQKKKIFMYQIDRIRF